MDADGITRAAQVTRHALPLTFAVTAADGVTLAGVHLPGHGESRSDAALARRIAGWASAAS